jgi:predicted nucleotidyltransferase
MIVSSEAIARIAKSLGKTARAKKVVLFGSHALGKAGSDSDVDFLVIAESNLPRHKRSRSLYASFHPYPFPMDILVYTPEEVDQQLKDPSSFVTHALAEGKELYVG